MQEIIEALNDLITDHWVKFVTAAAFTATGWVMARRKAARDWQKREFFNRVNFTLNSIGDSRLRIRTLAEKSCSDVFLNTLAVRQITAAAQETSESGPLIPLDESDRWYFLNAALNELSEQFASGLMARECGVPVVSGTFLLCLTNECDGALRTRKIRVQVIAREQLLNLPEKEPMLEQPHHIRRWLTLRQMAAEYAESPDQFLEIELTFPVGQGHSDVPVPADPPVHTESSGADTLGQQ